MNKFQRGLNYRNKIVVVFSLFIALVMLMVSIYSYKRESASIIVTSKQSAQINVEQIGQKLDMQMMLLNRISFSLAVNKTIASNMAKIIEDEDKKQEVENILTSLLISWKQISAITVFPLNGGTLFRSRTATYSNIQDIQKEEWYSQLSSSSENFIILPVYDKDETIFGAKPSLSIIRKIVNPESFVLEGYLKVDFPLTYITHNVLESSIIGDGVYKLQDQLEQTIISNVKDKEELPLFFSKSVEPSSGAYLQNVNGNTYIVSYAKLDQYPWSLVYYSSFKKTQNKIQRAYVIQIAIFSLCLLLSIIVSYFIARRLSLQIYDLKKGMSKAEEGNLNVKVKIRSRDEIGVLIHSFNRMVVGIKDLYEKLYVAELGEKNAQLQALQAQINPHFLFNTLEAIDALALSKESEVISELILKMSNCFRYALNSQSNCTLKEELEHCNDYVDIFRIKYPDKIELQVDVAEELKHIPVPRLIIQPIVENAIHH